MNLNKLFETQKKLDDHIVAEKGLQGQDLLDKKILALLTELGELANEWRGFKFWSEDQEPNDFTANPDDVCEVCKGQPVFYDDNKEKIIGFCENCDGVGVHFHNPLLEEYVDCLHFILTIGLELLKNGKSEIYLIEHYLKSMRNVPDSVVGDKEEIMKCFKKLFILTTEIKEKQFNIRDLFGYFDTLGGLLGFERGQIEQAYYDKNKINHERQESGY